MYSMHPDMATRIAQQQIAERVRDAEARRAARAVVRRPHADPTASKPRGAWWFWSPRPVFG